MSNWLRFIIIFILFGSFQIVSGQFYIDSFDDTNPKFELRSAWVATAIQLDWPKTTNPEIGERSLRNIIRRSKEIGMNAVVFQVVARGDAMYQSERLPWAPWLTGSPGGDPGWDPLEVAIEESRKLGMELHAWFNFALVASDHTPKSADSDPPHVVYSHPDWVEKVGDNHWLNPGIPDARQWQIDNVIELVENYDIDAVHFDYIRYPGALPNDSETMDQYNPEEIESIADWRRYNITEFVRDVYEKVNYRKPWVKVGSAVFAHYQHFPGAWPAGWGYSDYFQESRVWLEEEVHDYVAPMIYWGIGQDDDAPRFEYLVNEWAENSYGRHVYAGTAPYKSHVYNELPEQIDTVRAAGLEGQIHFRYDFVNETPPPFNDRYGDYSIVPQMEWMEGAPPDPPLALSYERIPSQGTGQFIWEDGDADGNAMRYVIYQLPQSTVTEEDLADVQNIYYFTGETSALAKTAKNEGNYFVVTALDRNSHESDISNVFELLPPETPLLATPSDGSDSERDTVVVVWEYPENTGAFDLQVSTNPDFTSDLLVNETNYTDTLYQLTGLHGQQEYFWRVRAHNPSGSGEFSEAFSFRTGFPAQPVLAYPEHGETEVPIDVTFYWEETPAAETYRFQLATATGFLPHQMVVDSMGVTDTTLIVSDLEHDKVYFWRIGAANEYGTSLWSSSRGFTTKTATHIAGEDGIPAEYSLSQNYPNPFNPATTIRYEIPEQGHVSIKIYDMLGREVAVLVDDVVAAGRYSVQFDASNLPSGIYIYRIVSDNYVESKRMTFVK